MVAAGAPLLTFGDFELDLETWELSSKGTTVRLSPQPIRVLAFLASRPGRLVTREEIQAEIWGRETHVDFVHGLNYCIRRIRAVLGDDAQTPRYIETLPKRGYRFIASVGTRSKRSSSAGSGRIMLAVLPFRNLGGDPDQEYFSDGLTDEMITQLGRVNPERLGIIARTSAMRYKASDLSIRKIGEELDAGYVLEGSVLREGKRVRISVRLVRVDDQSSLWSGSHETDVRGILALQRAVAGNVAEQIRIRLAGGPRVRTIEPEAYESYLKGRYFWNRRSTPDLRRSAGYFEAALALDPAYAEAWVGLADTCLTLLDYDEISAQEAMSRAGVAVAKALGLDETLAEAHSALGHASMHQFDWTTAEREFRRAIELNPSYSMAHFYYANYLMAVKRFDEAIDEGRRSRRLDPVAAIVEANAAFVFYHARRYGEALECCRNALEMDRSLWTIHSDIGRILEMTGDLDAAIAACREAAELSDHSPRALASLGHACGRAGKKKEALGILDQLNRRSRTEHGLAYLRAVVHLGLEDKDQALECLQLAFRKKEASLVFVQVDPRLDSLHGERAFEEIVSRMNFPSTTSTSDHER